MHRKLKQAFTAEMEKAQHLYHQNELDSAFKHLERAHILGQRFIMPHTLSHWWMFKVGIKRNDKKEMLGQITRMLASLVFSRIWVPLGNTGGARVSPFKPMPVPDDLAKLLQTDKNEAV